jgi:hypothetical protein
VTAEGPATVTLTDAERERIKVAGAHHPEVCDCSGEFENQVCDDLMETWGAVTDIVAARVAALTADLAAARVALDAMMERDTAASVRYDALATDHRRWVDKAFEADRVIANVRAAHPRAQDDESSPYYCPTCSEAAQEWVTWPCKVAALLPAAPTGEDS